MLFYNKQIFKRCFSYSARYWYMNIKEIPRYFKLIHRLIKYGYDSYANTNTYDWFMYTMKDILSAFRTYHHGYPVISLDDKEKQEEFEKEYDADFDMMISLLEDMDEDNPKYEDYNVDLMFEEMHAAKDKFFQLFAKHFYTMWD